jgi:hypothetical protein
MNLYRQQPYTLAELNLLQNQRVEPVQEPLSQKMGRGIGEFLLDQGVISDPRRAYRTGQTMSGILGFLPGIGDAQAGDEFATAAQEGDALGMGLGLMSAIPFVGKAKKGTGKVVRLFHGSDAEFDEFNPTRVGDRLTSLGYGHYLTPDKGIAKEYGKNLMEFDVDTSGFLDWKNMTKDQRGLIEKELLESVPESRISHFGRQKIKVLKRGEAGAKEFKRLKEETKDAYNDYAKARILDDDDIMAIDENLFDSLDVDDVVVGWREAGDLSLANNEQLMTLMNEYRPDLAKELGFKGAIFGNQVAVYDSKIPKRVK